MCVSATSICMAQDRLPALTPVPYSDVSFDDLFWKPRLETARKNMLPHVFGQCDETGRLANFRRAAGQEQGEFQGLLFNDSDVYKAVEGACYLLQSAEDEQTRALLAQTVESIIGAQDDDGYLNTYFTLEKPDDRWRNIRGAHELYCAGHLIEAGIAHHQVTNSRVLLDAAIRCADNIDRLFGPNEGQWNNPPGHQEIELALIKLYRHTGERRYLELARFFIEQRGREHTNGPSYGEYAQDHLPVREQTEVVGHAVRAMYQFCAMTDLCTEEYDEGYARAMERIWEDIVHRKMYITGGIGSSASNEGFTEAYDLPNDTAYSETCASIGLAMWNQRLALLHRDAKYFDVFERVVYNAVLSGVSLEGRDFFYVNRLASAGGERRVPWFSCACCPPNVLRFISSIGGAMYATSNEPEPSLFVNLYADSAARVTIAGAERDIYQRTSYPWSGHVEITLGERGEWPIDGAMHLRIPEWADSHTIEVNGQPIEAARDDHGYAVLRRKWRAGDVVYLNLGMPITRVYSNPRVEANRGRVALTRGPLVYCFEGAAQGADLATIVIPPDAVFDTDFLRYDANEPDLTILTAMALSADASSRSWGEDELYKNVAKPRECDVNAIPYFAWANGPRTPMQVWMPESLSALPPLPDPDVRASASHVYGNDSVEAMYDRREPASSEDSSIPRCTFWPRKGTTEWVRYDFRRAREIAAAGVYWFDDSGHGGGCATPVSAAMEYLPVGAADEEANWHALGSIGVERDRLNEIAFEPVEVSAVRLLVKLTDDKSAGVLEWRVGR